MTKGYCPICKKVIDQVISEEFGMCKSCYLKGFSIKHKNLMIRKGASDLYYKCGTMTWNYWLNRYYPSADLIMTVEHLNNGFKLKIT